MCLQCWQKGKEFRLHWHSFVRVQIYYKYWLSINRTNTRSILNLRSAVVSALASRIRGREFETHENHFPQNQIIIFYFLVFPFYFSQFWSKTVCENILKVRQYWICNGKEARLFLFFKMANTPHKGKTRHIEWLSNFLIKAQCFYRDGEDLAPDDKYYIRGKRNALWLWQHFGRTITLAVFDIPIVSTESQVLYSFIIKARMDTPNFYFLIFFW